MERDYAALNQAVRQAQVTAAQETALPDRVTEQRPEPVKDWKSVAATEVPAWRRQDRNRLDSADRRHVDQQLTEIEQHRAAGRLSTAEYNLVRQRLIENGPIEKGVKDENQLDIFGGLGRRAPGLPEQLKELGSLHASGALSDEDFTAAKNRLIRD